MADFIRCDADGADILWATAVQHFGVALPYNMAVTPGEPYYAVRVDARILFTAFLADDDPEIVLTGYKAIGDGDGDVNFTNVDLSTALAGDVLFVVYHGNQSVTGCAINGVAASLGSLNEQNGGTGASRARLYAHTLGAGDLISNATVDFTRVTSSANQILNYFVVRNVTSIEAVGNNRTTGTTVLTATPSASRKLTLAAAMFNDDATVIDFTGDVTEIRDVAGQSRRIGAATGVVVSTSAVTAQGGAGAGTLIVVGIN